MKRAGSDARHPPELTGCAAPCRVRRADVARAGSNVWRSRRDRPRYHDGRATGGGEGRSEHDETGAGQSRSDRSDSVTRSPVLVRAAELPIYTGASVLHALSTVTPLDLRTATEARERVNEHANRFFKDALELTEAQLHQQAAPLERRGVLWRVALRMVPGHKTTPSWPPFDGLFGGG